MWYLAAGATACTGTPCSPGYVGVAGKGLHVNFSNKHKCDSCVCLVTGASLSSDAVCSPCPAGTFTQNNACVACPLGSYSSSQGAENCSSCQSDNACSSSTSGRCYGRCNVLQIRANPITASGGYLCRYSKQPNAPEYPCTIPEPPTFDLKTLCDFENSLMCKYQVSPSSSGLQLNCWIEA